MKDEEKSVEREKNKTISFNRTKSNCSEVMIPYFM